MKSYDFDAVIYNGEIYCVECLPDGVDVNDEDVLPIFADSEWCSFPVCIVCQRSHDCVSIIGIDVKD